MDIFDAIDEAIKTGAKRWKELEKRYETVKKKLSTGVQISNEELAELMIIVVDHLRPMNPDPEQANKIGDELKKRLSKST